MSFLNRLQAHKGGLIRLKTEIYWYGGQIGWDKNPGRICLILDATKGADQAPSAATASALSTATTPTAAALLLIDGSPHWVWVAEEDVELL